MNKRLSTFIALTVLWSAPAVACPWAGGEFVATVAPDVDFAFSFDQACSSVKFVETHDGLTMTGPLVKVSKGWKADFGSNTEAVFDAKGKRVKVRRGGLSASARMKRTN